MKLPLFTFSKNTFRGNMTEKTGPPPLRGSCRLILTIMVFFGVYHLMALRFNLSMALGKRNCHCGK